MSRGALGHGRRAERPATGALRRVLSLVVPAVLAAVSGRGESPEDLLRRADVAAQAPDSFRARLRITAEAKALEIEVWRLGESRTLVRFLGPKERGKYLVRRDGALFFLAPGAKKPVKLGPAYKLKGSASLDDLLGIRYSRDYEILSFSEAPEGGTASFELRAKSKATYPTVHYVVDRATGLPVSAEYRLPSGKAGSVVEFAEWDPGARMRFRKLVFRDILRGGATTEVVLVEMEERPVAPALFDLADGTERARLFGAATKSKE